MTSAKRHRYSNKNACCNKIQTNGDVVHLCRKVVSDSFCSRRIYIQIYELPTPILFIYAIHLENQLQLASQSN